MRAWSKRVVLAGLLALAPAWALPAFPGAAGFGSQTPGGRGGRVIFVENLNDSGPGSFREACAATGPRTIVFRTGGVIELRSDLIVSEPFVTIAGQTAPGDGICLKGAGLVVKHHDVVLRGLRIRPGDGDVGAGFDNRDALNVGTQARVPHNVIIDHCSFSWSVDETLTFWYQSRDVTVQYCLLGEALSMGRHPKSIRDKQTHSMALLVGGGPHHSLSIHHNLLAHNDRRNPQLSSTCSVEFANNVVYNFGSAGSHVMADKTTPTILAHFLGNTYWCGENATYWTTKRGHRAMDFDRRFPPGPASRWYLSGNLGPLRTAPDQDEWLDVGGACEAFRSDQPVFTASNLQVQPAPEASAAVLRSVGAVPRDAVDLRLLKDVVDRTGKIIDRVEQVGGYPVYQPGTPPPDTDRDGLPDAWEQAHNLNPADPADAAADRDGDGYTNLEEWLNSFFGG